MLAHRVRAGVSSPPIFTESVQEPMQHCPYHCTAPSTATQYCNHARATVCPQFLECSRWLSTGIRFDVCAIGVERLCLLGSGQFQSGTVLCPASYRPKPPYCTVPSTAPCLALYPAPHRTSTASDCTRHPTVPSIDLYYNQCHSVPRTRAVP